MYLYICFAEAGLVLAKAGDLELRDLLADANAAGYLGPLHAEQAIAYLEDTYPGQSARLRRDVAAYIVSADVYWLLNLDRAPR